MAVIAYSNDLTTITDAQTITGWTALGGGGAGLSADVDFAIQDVAGTLLSITKQVSGASGATKGMIFDEGTGITPGADDHFFIWIYCATPGIMTALSAGGMRATIGSTSGNYTEWYIEGNDTYQEGGQRNVAIRYQTTAPSPGRIVGTPGATPQWFGGVLDVSTSSKAINLGIDVIRYGTGYYLTGGTGADPEGAFTGLAADNDSTANQYGLFKAVPGGYSWKGRLVIGQNTSQVATACEFLDSTGPAITIQDNNFANGDFTQLIIDHASTIVNITGATFQALGTNDIGEFNVLNAATVVNMTSCRWIDFGPSILEAATTMDLNTWLRSGAITQNGATISGGLIEDNTALVAVLSDDPELISDTGFISDGTGHALEIRPTGAGPFTYDYSGNTDSGYAGTDGSTGNETILIHPVTNSADITLNVIGGGTTPTIMEHADYTGTFTLVIAPVTLTVTVTDGADPIENVQVIVEASDNTADLPFEESITSINRSGSTATVVHTAHGIGTGKKVRIEGAAEQEYNGVKTISNVTTNGYDYTVSGTPATPATGTLLGTGVILEGLTNASGVITDTRSYSVNQPFTGKARKSTVSPLYVTGNINGTLDKDAGTPVPVQLVSDE